MRRSVDASSTQLRHRQHLEQLIVPPELGSAAERRHNVAIFIFYLIKVANTGSRQAGWVVREGAIDILKVSPIAGSV
jgi:hypothetical protein